MNTYILKYDVYNSLDFPRGTIVTVVDPKWEFEVVEGKLKGKRGNIADGLNGWLIEDTAENRKAFEEFRAENKRLSAAITRLNNKLDKLPTVNV